MTEESPPRSLKGIQPRERPRRVRSSAPQARKIGADVPAHRRFLDLGGGRGGTSSRPASGRGVEVPPLRRFCRDLRALWRFGDSRRRVLQRDSAITASIDKFGRVQTAPRALDRSTNSNAHARRLMHRPLTQRFNASTNGSNPRQVGSAVGVLVGPPALAAGVSCTRPCV